MDKKIIIEKEEKSQAIRNRESWLKVYVIFVFSSLIAWKLATSFINLDLSDFNFTDLLSVLMALFAIVLSVAFYFKAEETSNKFYHNSYEFTKEISEILGRIEAGFGEKLRHLDEGYTGLRDKFDNIPSSMEKQILNITEKSYNVEKEKKEIGEKYSEFDRHFNDKLKDAILENQNLKEIIKAKEDLIAYAADEKITHIAHEMLLPIQSIVATSENIYEETEDYEIKKMSKDIIQTLIKLYYTIENMRAIIYKNAENENCEPTNLYEPLVEMIDLFQTEANQKNLFIKAPNFKTIKNPYIRMSSHNIKQIFFNLIHNSIKYSYYPKKSKKYIDIIGYPNGNLFCVEISNYGVGIKPTEIAEGRIFQDGYRGELARDRSRTGSGLGLGSVKRIVEEYNGKIEVESKSEREIEDRLYKTTVKVCLPFSEN